MLKIFEGRFIGKVHCLGTKIVGGDRIMELFVLFAAFSAMVSAACLFLLKRLYAMI